MHQAPSPVLEPGARLGHAGARVVVAAVVAALVALATVPGASAQTQSGTVSIPDSNLRSAVEDALGKQSGDAITAAEMARLVVLDASNSGVRDVTGLQHAVNLRGLYLQGNRISSASSLSGLDRMQVLFLQSNDISSVDVTRMTDLRFLDLSNNELTAIDLSGQRTGVGGNRSSQLYALWLHGNLLTSIDLSGLTALRDRTDGASHPNYIGLRLDRNRLTSVTGLRDLPGRVWSLRLERNRLTSIDLSDVEHIHYLYLDGNPLSSTRNIAGFSGLTDLRRLHLFDTLITSIDLSPFSRLERAFLNDNYLSSVDVTGLDRIQRLWLRGNRITSVTGLEDIADTIVSLNLRTNRLAAIDVSPLTGLRDLYLSDNALASIDVTRLSRLEVLWLHNRAVSEPGRAPNPGFQNQITSVGRLPSSLRDLRLAGNPLLEPITVSGQSRLTKLYLSEGQISNVSEVRGLTGLTELGLTGMSLTDGDLSQLSRLSALEKLDLRSNSISGVASLASFPGLSELRLDDNSVTDVSDLSGLSALRDLYVAGNQIGDFSSLDALVDDGLTIHGTDDQQVGEQVGEPETVDSDSDALVDDGLTIDGTDDEQVGEPETAYWDWDDAGTEHGWDLRNLAGRGILDNTECDSYRICPNDPIKRWAIAVWLVRVLDGTDPEPLGYNRFEDVHPGLQWAAHTERLAELNVTNGCSGERALFCPQQTVTRAQMASLLTRALDLPSGTPSTFIDVDGQSVHAEDIDALAATGITIGCNVDGNRFCPDEPLTRGQLASFLRRAINFIAAN